MEVNDVMDALYYLGAYSSILNYNGLGETNHGLVFMENGLKISSSYETSPSEISSGIDEVIKVNLIKGKQEIIRTKFYRQPRIACSLTSDKLSYEDKILLIEDQAPTPNEKKIYLPLFEQVITDEDALTLFIEAKDLISIEEIVKRVK